MAPKKSNSDLTNKRHPGRGGNNVSLYPLTPDEALKAVLSISKEDAARIIGKKSGKKK